MSSRTSKKNATKVSNVIITRKKAALQNRQARAKSKKTVKTATNKADRKNDINSLKSTQIDTAQKDTPLQNKVRTLVRLVEQVEYRPDKLKRDFSLKKVFLKPKPNYKVIAPFNKRKSAVPQKGEFDPPSKRQCTSSDGSTYRSEVSMMDMVKLIEDNHNLSDEDFMEILTCPSPVWWEDPPDDGYIEDAICSRAQELKPPTNNVADKNRTEEQNKTKNNGTSTRTNKIDNKTNIQITNKKRSNNKNEPKNVDDKINVFKIAPISKYVNKFNEKKQKLESVLGNIKNVKKVSDKDEIKNNNSSAKINTPVKRRRVSNTTDGDVSDLSFNEEEILKHLEGLDIPVQHSNEQNVIKKVYKTKLNKKSKSNNVISLNGHNKTIDDSRLVPDILPPLMRKPNVNYKSKESSNSSSDCNIDLESDSNFRFISDDDVTLIDNCNDSNSEANSKNIDNDKVKSSNNDTDSHNTDCQLKDNEIKITNVYNLDKIASKKCMNDLTEYITVYKIVSNGLGKKNTRTKMAESMSNIKLGNKTGKVNTFFRKCKSNKRLKRIDSSLPEESQTGDTDLKIEKENSDEQKQIEDNNRLKSCDYSVKTQNGVKNCTCVDSENESIKCDSCNPRSDKTVSSSCKDVARISWKHNYLINQT